MQELTTMDLRIAVNFLGERRLITGHATGTTDATYRWDLDSGEILKGMGVSNITGDFEMDGEAFHMEIFVRNTGKKVK